MLILTWVLPILARTAETITTYYYTPEKPYPFDGYTEIVFESFTSLTATFQSRTTLLTVRFVNCSGSLPKYIFQNCYHLKTVELFKDIISISDYAFDGCT